MIVDSTICLSKPAMVPPPKVCLSATPYKHMARSSLYSISVVFLTSGLYSTLRYGNMRYEFLMRLEGIMKGPRVNSRGWKTNVPLVPRLPFSSD